MTTPFPTGRIPLKVEIAFGAEPEGNPDSWVWTDVSAYLLEQGITISRGRSGDAAEMSPSTATLTLDNGDGRFTPGLRSGAHWPNIRRGTPCRIWGPADAVNLLVGTDTFSGIRAPGTAAMATTAGLDLRVDVALDRIPGQWPAVPPYAGPTPWSETTLEIAARHRLSDPAKGVWEAYINADGCMAISFWNTAGTQDIEVCTVPLPFMPGQRVCLRWVLEPSTAGSTHTVSFYSAPSMNGPWTLVGPPVVRAGVVALADDATVPLDLGNNINSYSQSGAGRYYGFEVRNGRGGPIVASPDLTVQTPGATSFTDAQGNAFQLFGQSRITDMTRRLTGHIDSWTPEWPYGDLSQPGYTGESRCTITVAGRLRRLTQGQPPLPSPLRRSILADTRLVGYWPFEDGPLATVAASPMDGVADAYVTGVEFSAGGGPAGTLNVASLPDKKPHVIEATIPPHPVGDGWQCEFLFYMEKAPAPTDFDTLVAFIRTTGTPWNEFDVNVVTNPTTSVTTIDVYGNDFTPGSRAGELLMEIPPTNLFGHWVRFRIQCGMAGANAYLTVSWIDEAGTITSQSATFQGGGGTPGRMTRWETEGRTMELGFKMGHLAVFNDTFGPTFEDPFDWAAWGYQGEVALVRMDRMAREVGFEFTTTGFSWMTERLGVQPIATMWEVLSDCAHADGGMLIERRELPGFHYRPRYQMYGLPPAVTLDASKSEIAAPFSPVLDDQLIRNDVTASRTGGSSAQVTDEESIRLVGRYQTSVTFNVATDGQLPGLAYHVMSLGQGEKLRYPQVSGSMMTAGGSLAEWLSLDVGARLQITGLPPQHPDGVVDLLVQGYSETITPTSWEITANCTPYAPWVGAHTPVQPALPSRADAPDRVDSDHTILGGDLAPADLVMRAHVKPPGQTWTAAGRPLNDNPQLQDSLGDWTVNGGTVALVDIPPAEFTPDTRCARITPNGTTTNPRIYSDRHPVNPGRPYRATGWIRSTDSRQATLYLYQYDSTGALIESANAPVTVPAGEWTRLVLSDTSNANAVEARVGIATLGTPPASAVFWAKDVLFRTNETGALDDEPDFPFDLRVGPETVRCHGIQSVTDAFTRTTTNGWGHTDSGLAYEYAGGTLADFSTTGTQGRIAMPDFNSQRHAIITGPCTDADITILTSVSQLALTNSLLSGITFRYQNGTTFYRARLNFKTDGTLAVNGSSPTGTTTLITVPGLTYAANTEFRFRARLTGQKLEMKVWPGAAREPDAWTSTVTFGTNIPFGSVGVFASAFNDATNVNPLIWFNELRIDTPQWFGIQRGIDGTTPASVPAGTPVTLAHPATVTL